MSIKNIILIESDFDATEIEAIIDQAERRECICYLPQFVQKLKEAEQSGNTSKQNWFQILYCIVSLHLKSDEIYKPFGPLAVMENRRSTIVEDFTDNQLTVLEHIVGSIADHELRARISDVLWVTKKKYRCAQIAIESYLESAKLLEHPENWTQCDERIKRAANLAKSLGKHHSSLSRVIDQIKEIIARYDGTDPLFLSYNMMNLLLDCGEKDNPLIYSNLSEKLAKNAEAKGNWLLARHYWEIKSKWDILIDSEKSKESLKLAAETFVREANDSISRENPSYTVASSHPQAAIECLRKTGGYKERINEIHLLLLEYQKKPLKNCRLYQLRLIWLKLSKILKNRLEANPYMRLYIISLYFLFHLKLIVYENK